jgi:dTDP-4-dehydrorhamnose reductase
MARTLVLGAGGMLGSAFVAALPNALKAGRTALDIADLGQIERTLREAKPDLVVNCAAHTAVDVAEVDPEDAYAVNAILPGVVATICRQLDVPLVHLSSTGCYGDWKAEPYLDHDPLCPTTTHHRSKADGEGAVRDAGCEHLIVRTGWLFGGAPGLPKNFVWNRLVEALGKDHMSSDATQVGNPTAVHDLVAQVIRTVESGFRGTVNIVSQGAARRADYVARIVAAASLPCVVVPQSTPFERPARVSPNEAAVNFRLQRLALDAMPHWTDAVDAYVAELVASPAWQQRKEAGQ